MTQDPEEISKKDLLELTGISYGQLYRWKRKGLIPEAWFVKKAAFTGQETFFPRAAILERVQRIQGMKDDINLDRLAHLLSPAPPQLELSEAAFTKRNIVSKTALDLLQDTLGPCAPFDFQRMLLAWLVDRPLAAGDLSLEEGALLLRTLWAARESAPLAQGELLFLRKRGVGLCLLVQGAACLDPETRVLVRLDLPAQAAELKLALDGGRP